jgi:guanylate kinase
MSNYDLESLETTSGTLKVETDDQHSQHRLQMFEEEIQKAKSFNHYRNNKAISNTIARVTDMHNRHIGEYPQCFTDRFVDAGVAFRDAHKSTC